MLCKLVKSYCIFILKHQKVKERLQLILLLVTCINFSAGLCAGVSLRDASKHRIQRRFMWKQMDHTMDGLVDGMKNMFDARTTASTMTDFLPAETTRVKYIIRSPHTNKALKVIKLRPHKKVRKLQHFPSMKVLRKLEKEQEMIAEGYLLPKPSKEISPLLVTQTNLLKYNSSNKEHNEIFTGKIKELVNDWRPVNEFRGSKSPSDSAITEKPYPMSQLHTSIVGESLPKPEKLIHQPSEVHDYSDMTKKRLYEAPKNTYEVTEFLAEESVALPLTQEYHNIHGFLPSTRNAKFQIGAVSSSTTTTTTTEDPPNYPAPFLRKYRERASAQIPQKTAHFRASSADLDISWIPSTNVSKESLRVKQHLNRNPKTPKWPVESPSARPALRVSSTEAAIQQAAVIAENVRKTIYKNGTSKTLRPNNEATRSKDTKPRGSVKFGDRISPE